MTWAAQRHGALFAGASRGAQESEHDTGPLRGQRSEGETWRDHD
jgi:hypothetical protein